MKISEMNFEILVQYFEQRIQRTRTESTSSSIETFD